MTKIIQQGDKTLREISKPIPVDDIKNEKIKKVLVKMKDALDQQEDGVALAAPQIGIHLCIFVVSEKTFEMQKTEGGENEGKANKSSNNKLIYINPKIIKLSKKKQWLEEGCLSVRWLYGDVRRSTNITISAYDEEGRQFTRGAGGLLAQIFQHEIDHLNGILFIDKAKNIEEILPDSE